MKLPIKVTIDFENGCQDILEYVAMGIHGFNDLHIAYINLENGEIYYFNTKQVRSIFFQFIKE